MHPLAGPLMPPSARTTLNSDHPLVTPPLNLFIEVKRNHALGFSIIKFPSSSTLRPVFLASANTDGFSPLFGLLRMSSN
jgi:hypothetical protein